ncbi:hypothetical protein BDV96DRAFT_630490 [Lophiotrema nucula]|uniref:Uncharacterized protein n=1 Tax=Lophiotrema nucula TaxID=690887 RepID=A0A6A5ZEY1_9PLEO|nr:hypothetical protein BDV96DRAFT_630490 [Lophiotrema nucula]
MNMNRGHGMCVVAGAYEWTLKIRSISATTYQRSEYRDPGCENHQLKQHLPANIVVHRKKVERVKKMTVQLSLYSVTASPRGVTLCIPSYRVNTLSSNVIALRVLANLSTPGRYSKNDTLPSQQTTIAVMLLDLPPEMLQRVITCYVKTAGVLEAWKSREACRTFRDYVSEEILARQPPEVFRYKRKGTKAAQKLFDHNAAAILGYRVNSLYGVNRFIPFYIRDVVSELMDVDGNINDGRRQKYTQILSKLLVANYPCVGSLLRTDPSKPVPRGIMGPLDAENSQDLLVAAAAVGDLDALQHFIAMMDDEEPEQATQWSNGPHQSPLWRYSKTFGYPLAAAAYAGNEDIVKAVYKLILIRKSKVEYMSSAEAATYQTVVESGITQACQSLNFRISDFLLSHFRKDFEKFTENGFRTLLSTTVRWRSKDEVVNILNIGHSATRKTYTDAFFSALRDREDDIVLLFIEKGLIHTNHLFDCGDCPLSAAVARGRLPIVRRLLDAGASPDGATYGGWRSRTGYPLWQAARKGDSKMVKLLLDRGADLHLVKRLWDNKHNAEDWKITDKRCRNLLIKAFKKSDDPKPHNCLENFADVPNIVLGKNDMGELSPL